MTENNCCCRTKERSEKEFKDLMNRLKRIEGQVKGVQRMLEEDAYCPDIMVQVSAINSALNSFNKVLLSEHLRTCVVDDIKAGREDTRRAILGGQQAQLNHFCRSGLTWASRLSVAQAAGSTSRGLT